VAAKLYVKPLCDQNSVVIDECYGDVPMHCSLLIIHVISCVFLVCSACVALLHVDALSLSLAVLCCRASG
jgi:hypothetical protein